MTPHRAAVRLLGLLALAALPAAARAQAPLTFLDRPISAWVTDLKDNRAEVRRSAAFVLGQAGRPDTLLPLLAALPDKDPSVREAIAFAVGEIGLRPNEPAEPVVKGLMDLLKDREDPRVRRSAAYALGRIGPRASAAGGPLLELLQDPAPMVRQNAAWALAQLDEDARKAAVDGLIKVLAGDPDPLVRRDVAVALGKIGRDAHGAVPVLLKRFQDPNEDAVVRRSALEALVGVVTPKDTGAIATLRASLKDKDPDVVHAAAFALANIGGKDASDALPVLRKAYREGDAMTRRLAATALASVARGGNDEVLPDLKAALKDADAQVRLSAAVGLGYLGDAAHEALPDLIETLRRRTEVEEVRKYAAEALSNIDPNDTEVVAAMLRVLHEKGSFLIRHRAIWSLERLKDFEQPEVVKALALTLEDDEPQARLIRYEAAKVLALKLRERVPDKVIDVLLEALGDDRVKVYRGTGTQVSGSGTEVRTGQAQVKETGTGDFRAIVAISLGLIGRRAATPEVLDGLMKLSEDSFDPLTRDYAKRAYETLKQQAGRIR